MKKYFVAEGTNVTRSTDCHDYKFAIIGRSPTAKHVATGGFRADRAPAESEAARLNREGDAYAARSGKPSSWTWSVVPAIEISLKEFNAIKKAVKV